MRRRLMMVAAAVALGVAARAAEDPYLAYIRSAPEFKPVRRDPKMLLGRWNTWVYMPWRYQWHIGTGDAGGQFCKDYGFNGGFTDHGDTRVLPWLEKWGLLFYNDHTAAKGYLYLNRADWKRIQTDGRALRFGANGPRPLDAAMLEKLKGIVTERVNGLKKSPVRAAYALDDEISWGSFVKPIPWRIHDDDADYEKWLVAYTGDPTAKAQYLTPEFTRAQLGKPLGQLDFSPFLDRMTYNDSYWAVFLRQLVETSNAADPETPCGFVGGQSPNLFGGYDYAKLMKNIQFLESYNIGSSTAIIRSFNPQNAMPIVTTHFHNDGRGTANDIWQTWYYLAHGNRGMIGWVEGWFEQDGTPRPWLKEYAPTNKEVGGVQGRKLVGARWLHDGVAVYYSHPSIQVSWCLDSEAHGKTWVNRNNDHRLGTSHLVRKAWEYLLTDSGLQFNFVPYDEVVVGGVPKEYRVLILPACYALSDIEAVRIREFVEAGGTLIADFAPGLFDHRGKGRAKGALDDLFGVKHDGTETKRDFFGGDGKLWVETNQDAAFGYKKYRELFATVPCKLADEFAIAEPKLKTHIIRKIGKGTAVLVNLSPQRYLQYREEGSASEQHRNVFVQYALSGGAKPWVRVAGPDGARPRNCEATYWSKGGRTYVFVLQNAEVTGSDVGGGGVEGLAAKKHPITVAFPSPVKDAIDERTGKKLGDGASFTLDFNPVEAAFFSFEGGGRKE
ncbi:MAG TPA: beta-galactosidase trimerization domain-containing protein [Planctomycetota bacterium]|nr:beta-galactosidase trimerization domain-containing protein [Planctomycetota bacterium]HRR80851.1 beta-galactosidase trimerization domain-containing protein [Planctomycetota bacterium]HRT95960.1 beta-galactosidase trimerization domain-containing protein [Planctomycetota bacterium]